MTDRSVPPAPLAAALVAAFPRVEPANRNDRYDERLTGFRPAHPVRTRNPPPVLDPDVVADLRAACPTHRSP